MTLALSATDQRDLVTHAAAIDAIEAIHRDLSLGDAVQPAPTVLKDLEAGTSALTMPAASKRLGLIAVKTLVDAPPDPATGRNRQRSVITVSSTTDGSCVAILDGHVLTRQRTAATTAAATRHLARADSSVLGLIGAGALAVEHVATMREVRPIERVIVWSRRAGTVASFAAQISELHPDLTVEVAATPREVVQSVDVLCTLTPSREPVVHGAWFTPGLHVNAVGAPPRPEFREIDSAGIAIASLFVDNTETALQKSGEIIQAIADHSIDASAAYREIGDVIAGLNIGRASRDDITLFDSVGLGIQDLALAAKMIEQATKRGIGQRFDLSGSPAVVESVLG